MPSPTDQGIVFQAASDDSQLIFAFVQPSASGGQSEARSGNACLLQMLAGAPGEAARVAAGSTCCQSWITTHKGRSVIAVSCYTPDGLEIQCCGHGLLAAAYNWQKRLELHELDLLMNGSVVSSWWDQQTTWLRFERLPTTPCITPKWVGDLFAGQAQPVAASLCGGETGYLVLQWPDDFDLKRLPQPSNLLSKHTQRALIYTSAQPFVGTEAIQLRYFAPQYGVSEDTATGSAVRVLAEYWSSRFTRLTAEQRSPRGGQLLAQWTPSHIEVGGQCYILDKAEAHD